MYAVVKTGGKQYRVAEGEQLDVERLDAAGELTLEPVLVVDDGQVLATPGELEQVTVTARVVGERRGPKITGLTYKAKANERRRWGHRQALTTIEITGIRKG